MMNKCYLGAIMTETALLLEVLVVVAYMDSNCNPSPVINFAPKRMKIT